MMKKFMKKLWDKKDSQKGFTLVELIVVLVILAILAAIMVPSLIGWINKAREKEIILSARNAELAAQELVMEYYAQTKTGATVDDAIAFADETKIQKLAQYDDTNATSEIKQLNADYTIKLFYYYDSAKKMLAKYEDGVWTIGPDATGIPTT